MPSGFHTPEEPQLIAATDPIVSPNNSANIKKGIHRLLTQSDAWLYSYRFVCYRITLTLQESFYGRHVSNSYLQHVLKS
jgi:hypothetical protein